MAAKGTVPIRLSREQAITAARWLREHYRPGESPYLPTWSQNEWKALQRKHALALSATLDTAARRKRKSGTDHVFQPVPLN